MLIEAKEQMAGTSPVTKFTEEDRERFEKATKIVKTAGKNIRRETLKVIATLGIIDHYRWYEMEGFKSIAEYADKYLQLAPATRSTYLQIARKFMHEDGDTYSLDEEYAAYNISQLMEMSSIKDQEFLKEFTPDKTIAEMKQMKKAKKSELLNGKKTAGEDTGKDIVFVTTYDKTFPTVEAFRADGEFQKILEQAEQEEKKWTMHILV